MDYVETVQSGANSFARPFVDMFSSVAEFLPVLLAAFVVLIVGLIVSPLVGKAVTKAFELIKTDEFLDQMGVYDAMKSIGMNFSISHILGVIAKYTVLIVFITMVAEILDLGELSRLIQDFIRFIPQIVIGLVIIGVGLIAADWLRDMVRGIAKASDSADYADLLGSITRISVIVFAVMAALVQVGIAQALIQIMFAGVVFGLALAFGLGAKDTVARAIDSWMK
ncbi:MAG: mechanosensitive ion channel family protein [Patescibacteria group bacterium]